MLLSERKQKSRNGTRGNFYSATRKLGMAKFVRRALRQVSGDCPEISLEGHSPCAGINQRGSDESVLKWRYINLQLQQRIAKIKQLMQFAFA